MLDFTPLTDRLGDAGTAVALGALVGALFGALAQVSRFCLRAAVHEVGATAPRGRLGIWLAGLGAAIIAAQTLVAGDAIDTFAVRALNEAPSLSGALIGGLLFGAGMMLANGCASRHLVLAGTGNLRAWAVIAVFATTAWLTIAGPLAPFAQAVAAAWRLDGGAANALAPLGLPGVGAIALGACVLALGLWLAHRARLGVAQVSAGLAVGLVIAAGWALTTALSRHTFEPTPVESAAFTAPAAHFVALLAAPGDLTPGFDTGFIPAVVAGAFLAALAAREVRIQWFENLSSALTYLAGAALMGFGGVVAIGCSVGGLSNAALMITASLLALAAMWAGALITARLTRLDWQGALEAYRPGAAGQASGGVIAHTGE